VLARGKRGVRSMVVGLMDRWEPKRTRAHGCDAKAHGLRIRRLIVGCGGPRLAGLFFFWLCGNRTLVARVYIISLQFGLESKGAPKVLVVLFVLK
jgi:hypothetical protein